MAALAVLTLAAPGCKKTPARESFAVAWRQATSAKDGAAAWRLLDAKTQARILAGVRLSQERAAGDPSYRNGRSHGSDLVRGQRAVVAEGTRHADPATRWKRAWPKLPAWG